MVKLSKCLGSYNTLNGVSNKVLQQIVPNIRKDLNLNVFKIITRVNGSKILTKLISFERKCRFDGRKYKSDQ